MASESTLNSLWRNAILIKSENKCIFCSTQNGLQAHHIIRCRKLFLRHDIKNGVMVCHDCHLKAHTKKGEKFIVNWIGADDWNYLCESENVIMSTWLQINDLSRKEFTEIRKKELKDYIQEEG